MRFEQVPVASAVGTVLAHSHRLGDSAILKKGHPLTAVDCGVLAGAGVEQVTVARLEDGDLGEDEAARLVAETVAGPCVSVAHATTGRANLFASGRGLFVVSRACLDEVNLCDEAITIATLAPFAVVGTGEMIATVKIIPFAVPASVVARASDRARANAPLLAVAPFVRKRAGLVLSVLPGIRDELLARAAENQRRRMVQLGGEVAREVRVEHDTASVANAIDGLLDEGLDLVLVLGASAIVDRKDVIPAAVEAIGGVVQHLGMPVDPGNLLLLARKGQVPIVGVPGCARTLKPSGFDWVLQRLAANVPLGPDDIMRLGAGGLLPGGRESRIPRTGRTE